MRIGMITGEYPPLEGGVGAFTRELGLALTASGHELHILTTDIGTIDTVRRDPALHVDRLVRYWDWASQRRIIEWATALSLDLINIQYQSAAYQLNGWINMLPRWHRARLAIPIVVTYHDLLPPYLFPKAGRLRKWTVWQLAQYADGVIVTNDEDYTELTSAIGGAIGDAAPPTRLIPIGSNIAPNPPSGYNRTTWRAEHGFSSDTLLVGFFGFLNRSKGVEALIGAVGQLAREGLPVHLLFVGGRTGSSDVTNARYADEIDALIGQSGIGDRVHRTGFTTPKEVSAALLAVDVCALPYRDGVNFRRGTLHAALAHGNAIVTTAPPLPTPQLRDGSNVVYVPPENADALAAAIRDLWQHPDARAALGREAAALAQEFSWERIAAHTADFFRALVRR